MGSTEAQYSLLCSQVGYSPSTPKTGGHMQSALVKADAGGRDTTAAIVDPTSFRVRNAQNDAFARTLRRCLENLNNPQALASNPLANLQIVQMNCAQRAEKMPLRLGLALQDVIVEAIEQLKPLGQDAEPDRESTYPYAILTDRFVRDKRHNCYEGIAQKLALSKSSYYRRLDESIQLLAMTIKRMNEDASDDLNATSGEIKALAAAPPVPNHEYFVGRDELVAQIKQLLVKRPAPHTLGLWGMPGAGKTTLLVQLANDPDIRAMFPDGILWGSLGCNPNLAAVVQSWCLAMHVPNEKLSEATTVADSTKLLHAALASCRVLIIVDDVWDIPSAIPLKVRGPNTCVLFTSRFPEVAAALAGANTLKVDELSLADSFAMLKAYAPYAIEQFPDKTIFHVHDGFVPEHYAISRHLKKTRSAHRLILSPHG
ncbi:MAG: hypothetical protein HC853_18365, partial [Anaerolineae bacterium]|nr:hypothetical protein [Anaerolineae bacterium]